MFKFVLTGLCAVACMGVGFTLATASAADKPATPAVSSADPADAVSCPGCGAANAEGNVVTLAVADTAPATQKAADVKNTKCPVTGDDIGEGTFVYEGKLYHTCCSDCAKEFKKDPDKYLKAMAADPAKYGIPK